MMIDLIWIHANGTVAFAEMKGQEETTMLRIMLETKDGRHVTSADIPVNGEDDWPEVVMFEGRPFTLDAESGGLVTYTEAATLTLPPPIKS